MKNLFITLCLMAWVTSYGLAQTDYLQWEAGYVSVQRGQWDNFKKGIAAHAKKYHASDPYKMWVWEVLTGPNSGKYFIALGPATFTQLDNRPDSPEHNADWQNSVSAYLSDDGETSYWRLDQNLSYRPAGSENFGKSRLRYSTLHPGESDRFEEQLKKVMEVYKAKKYAAGWATYWRYGFSTGPHVATEINFDNWAYLDTPNDFRKDFEEVHGAGSWDRFLEEIAIAVDRSKTFDELISFSPELSSPQQ